MEGILECPVCAEQYDRSGHLPLVLICGHTLCKRCATNLHKTTGKITCPLDRKPDNRQIQQISHSFHILDLIEHISDMSQTLKYLKLPPSERLIAMQKQAEENLEKCKDHIGLVTTRIAEIREKKEKTLAEINESFSVWKQALEDRQQTLETEVMNIAAEEIEKFEGVKNETQELFDGANITIEHLLNATEEDIASEDVKPISQLPDLPTVDMKLKFVIDLENAEHFIKHIGKIGKWSVTAPIECDNYTNVTYWMVPSCCSQYYCCNKCHDKRESHPWAYANRMVCMFCEKEQDYRKLPNHCEFCNEYHKGVVSK
ncbi:unnamed protein product [Blepharisma stoltei]|uniref:RING-type domain-containing protein n=1 Tax=Blepharisma stoltei TaxID=1481888 RepID=A0AAU9JSH7_9CILI|nr:unnamed protein product [Blepharisma stoltei]